MFFFAVEKGAETPIQLELDGFRRDNDFPIRAGNTAATLELFDQLGSASASTYTGHVAGTAGKNALVGADALTFTATPTPTDPNNRPLLYGKLSTTQVVTDGTLEVFIDDFPATVGGHADVRTWYDGIGFELAPAPIAISSFTAVGGGIWEVTLEGQAETAYEFRSAADLVFDPGTLIENLTQGDPGDPGTISGTNDSLLTTDANGAGTVRMSLSGPANFVRAQTP